MKIKSIPVWVIVIVGIALIFYGSLIILDCLGLNSFKYEVDTDGTILINNEKFTINNEMTSFYDTDSESFYVVGIFNNNTKKTYYGISLEFAIYDLDGNILGNAITYIEKINANESWKFKANYVNVDATDAVSYKLVDVSYYR